MSKKKIVSKDTGDAAEIKKQSPKKWGAIKSGTTAEILWHKIVDEEEKNMTAENETRGISTAGSSEAEPEKEE